MAKSIAFAPESLFLLDGRDRTTVRYRAVAAKMRWVAYLRTARTVVLGSICVNASFTQRSRTCFAKSG